MPSCLYIMPLQVTPKSTIRIRDLTWMVNYLWRKVFENIALVPGKFLACSDIYWQLGLESPVITRLKLSTPKKKSGLPILCVDYTVVRDSGLMN